MRCMAALDALGITTNRDRYEAIRALRKGLGLSGNPKVVDLSLFGVESWEALNDAVLRAERVLPQWKASAAILNALNPSLEHVGLLNLDQLMDRRRKFAHRNGLSMRTVERLEDVGAAILDDHFRRTMDDPAVYDIVLRIESDVASLKRSGSYHGISDQMLDTLEVIVEAVASSVSREERDRWVDSLAYWLR